MTESLTQGRVIRSELMKLLWLRATLLGLGLMWLLAIVLSVTVSLPLAQGVSAVEATEIHWDAVAVSALPLAMIAFVLGAFGDGGDLGGDSGGTRVAVPRYRVLAASKWLAAAIVGGAGGIVGATAAIAINVLVAVATEAPLPGPEIAGPLIAVALGCAAFSVLGIATASAMRSLQRSAIGAIVLTLALPIAIGIGVGTAGGLLASLLPTSAVQSLTTRPGAPAFTIPGTLPSQFEAPTSALVLCAWVLASLVITLIPWHRAEGYSTASRARIANPSPRRFTNHRVAAAIVAAWYQLATTPSVRYLALAAAIVLPVLVGIQAASQTPSPELPDIERAVSGLDLASIIVASGSGGAVLLFAALGALAAHYFFLGPTSASVALALPRRSMVYLTSVAAVTSGVALLALVASGVGVALAAELLGREGFGPVDASLHLAGLAIRSAIALTLGCLLGFAATAALRSLLAALGFIAVIYVAAPALGQLIQPLVAYTPSVWIYNVLALLPNAPGAVNPGLVGVEWIPILAGGVAQPHPNDLLTSSLLCAVALLSLAAARHRRQSLN